MSATPLDRRLAGLMPGALGVVYGDIGTSPLYALKECFAPSHHVAVDSDSVRGVLSMIVWTLLLIVCGKYVTVVLRADNRGEGGILALLSLAFGVAKGASRRPAALLALGVFGAALLYGDGIITPCITVMGAIEGLEVAAPAFTPYVVPISIAVLIVLFGFQHAGTGRVGAVLGPIMVVWFATLAVLGVRGIAMAPEVLQSLLPWHAVSFVSDHGWNAFLVMGTVFLVVTGAEALYAGQGGLLLSNPDCAKDPFFLLAPRFALYPLVALSVVASCIASQALIAGTFSITMHAIQLGYLPRMEVRHTSPDERGQIYLPHVNWFLAVGCIAVCLGFGSSSALANAYGMAVTLTMLITTALFYFAARRVFGWSAWRSVLLCTAFGLLELVFFGANLAKIAHGGWFPLLVALCIFTVMYTWKAGRRLLYERYSTRMVSIDSFLDGLRRGPPLRVPGTAVYMAGSADGTPMALLHNLKHNKVLHEQVLLLTIVVSEDPHVPDDQRVSYEEMPLGFHRMVAKYGFMQRPRVLELVKLWKEMDVEVRISDTTFFLSRETIVPAKRRHMSAWRGLLFAFLSRNAQPATAFFGLPANRVVELGVQIEF